jgi:bifunctional enzyme CysN/CysC
MIYEDQLTALQSASVKHGTTGDDFDPALLTDGLKAEREQGITIDVAYRYFSTKKRKFIIADTPGHEQYTRNMVTGASTCDLAIILIDARQGVLTQTKRHSFLVSLLGIQNIVVAINNMDLVDYNQECFDEISAEYLNFSAKLNIPTIEFVPISALKGTNIVHQASQEMPWYRGATLLHLLETTPITTSQNLIDFRFPIQYVIRPHLDFRGYAGTVSSGTIRPNEDIVALPSMQRAKIKKIILAGKEVHSAVLGQTPVLVLDREIDLSRGDMMVRPKNRPRMGRGFEAMLVWMSETPLNLQQTYIFKHTTKQTLGRVLGLQYQINVNSLHRQDCDTLDLNEIGRVQIQVDESFFFDPYQLNRTTGAVIMIDRITHDTVGVLMILNHLNLEQDLDENIQNAPLQLQERSRLLGFTPLRIKTDSSLLYKIEKALLHRGIHAFAQRPHTNDLDLDALLPQIGVVWIMSEGSSDLEVKQTDTGYILKTSKLQSDFTQFSDLIDQMMVTLRKVN